MSSRINVLKMGVNLVTPAQVVDEIRSLVSEGRGGYVCVSNVHMCMETFDDDEFRDVVNNADIVVPDGRPVYWAQRLLGVVGNEQVRGQDLMNSLCLHAVKHNLNVGLYGGASDDILGVVSKELESQFPKLNISFKYSPPFRDLTKSEESAVVGGINKKNVDILFVGIGCPKQEKWMARHKGEIKCVMLGVGAAFDFVSGNKQHAPKWMQKIGLEWLFRLCSEPRRLWKRYLKQNPRFIFYFLQQWLLGKKFN